MVFTLTSIRRLATVIRRLATTPSMLGMAGDTGLVGSTSTPYVIWPASAWGQPRHAPISPRAELKSVPRGRAPAAVMTWARALGEFGATIIFAGNFPGRTQTMPLAIYLGFELDLNIALTLAVILLAASFLVLLIVKGLLGQRVRL